MRDTNGRTAIPGAGGRDDEPLGRRRVLAATAGFAAVGLSGCSDVFGSGGDGEPGGTETEAGGTEDTATEVAGTEGDDEGTETDEETPDEGSDGEEDGEVHEHGRLYIDIDGDRFVFDRPKYYQESNHSDGRAPHRFHFHADDGDPYRWHMHDRRQTLAEALQALPDIDYAHDGTHVVEIEGEMYVDGEGGTTVEFSQRGTEIDPREYELQNQDVLYVTVETGGDS